MLEAFWRLDRDRSYFGMDGVAGPIPYRSVVEYAHWHAVGDFEAFYGAIRWLDGAYRRHLARQNRGSMPEAGAGWFGGQRHHVSDRPMSPELFDAVFGGGELPKLTPQRFKDMAGG